MVSQSQNPDRIRLPAILSLALATALVGALGACSADDGDNGAPGDPGPTPEIEIGAYEALPGVNVAITSVSGGSGAGGNVRAGDILTVEFTAENDAGDPLDLTKLTRSSIYVSGPTSNYQRVIASQSDVLTRATEVSEGVYSYRFAVPVPSTFLAPLNDTASLTDGELTGQALLNGTYTVGMELRKDFTIEGEVFRDVGNATSDFLFGTAAALEPREVVLREACNACHTNLQAHGGNRLDIVNCLLCHTAGAEDRNTANVAGGTPGVGIEFSVMIHKIHTGTYLPSVLGIATNADGTRKYDATPAPYQIIGFGDSLIDFSHVVFPAYPSFAAAMPRDSGYTALGAPQKSLEDRQRRGPVECAKCHGDPDGAGPLAAPAQGDNFKTHPTTRACGSCHDDWDPAKPYTANLQTMPADLTDADCTLCHEDAGTPLSIETAHMHPLANPALSAGVNFVFDQITDAGGDNDGNFDAGETVRVTFRVENDNGDPIAASTLSRIETILSGPTMNPQMMCYQRVPPAYFTGNGPYTIDLPDLVFYEPAGTSNNTLQVFTTPAGTALERHGWRDHAAPAHRRRQLEHARVGRGRDAELHRCGYGPGLALHQRRVHRDRRPQRRARVHARGVGQRRPPVVQLQVPPDLQGEPAQRAQRRSDGPGRDDLGHPHQQLHAERHDRRDHRDGRVRQRRSARELHDELQGPDPVPRLARRRSREGRELGRLDRPAGARWHLHPRLPRRAQLQHEPRGRGDELHRRCALHARAAAVRRSDRDRDLRARRRCERLQQVPRGSRVPRWQPPRIRRLHLLPRHGRCGAHAGLRDALGAHGPDRLGRVPQLPALGARGGLHLDARGREELLGLPRRFERGLEGSVRARAPVGHDADARLVRRLLVVPRQQRAGRTHGRQHRS
jgi:hypothetical protein